MAEDELTGSEKAALLAHVDLLNPDDYDKEFYEALKSIKFPGPDNVDDRLRRAIKKFVTEDFTETIGGLLAIEDRPIPAILAIITSCLLRGYELGRKLHRPLTVSPDF